MSLQIKLISEDSKTVTYGYELEYDKLYFHFDKVAKTVRISYQRFILVNKDNDWTTQDEWVKYSCKYGYWQSETPDLAQKDVEFIYQTLKDLKGGEG